MPDQSLDDPKREKTGGEDADPGRWTWCVACLTVYDDYGTPVSPIPEFAKVH